MLDSKSIANFTLTDLKDLIRHNPKIREAIVTAFGTPKYFYEYKDAWDGFEETNRCIELSLGSLCYNLSKKIAFDDCNDQFVITRIVADGKELHYLGWQPGMVFEFADRWGNVVYHGEFPEWDH